MSHAEPASPAAAPTRHPAGGYEYRCPKCGKLLLTGEFRGWVRTNCKSQECGNKLRRFESR